MGGGVQAGLKRGVPAKSSLSKAARAETRMAHLAQALQNLMSAARWGASRQAIR